jgi:nucleoside-diphosphate-sugar epimerase
MRALVIGGTGLVGSYLVKRLVADGHKVSIVSRSVDRVPKTAQAIVADVSLSGWAKNAAINPLDFDVVVYLAYATTDDGSYDRTVTVDSAIELMEHFKMSSLQHFLYGGSMSVFGLELPVGNLDESAPRVADNDYAKNKIDASSAVMSAGVDYKVSVLHPTGVYDKTSKRLKSYRKMLSSGYLVLDAGGHGINNIVHAGDLAAAIYACSTRVIGKRAEEYVVNGEGISYAEWLSILESENGLNNLPRLPAVFTPLYRGPLRRFLIALGYRIPIIMPAYKRKIYERESRFISKKAEVHFGWQPKIFFQDAINSTHVTSA